MSPKRSVSKLILLLREGSPLHSQKVMRSLLATDGTAWKRGRKPEGLRLLSSLVFGTASQPTGESRSDRRAFDARLPPMRLGGRFDGRLDLDDAAESSSATRDRIDSGSRAGAQPPRPEGRPRKSR
jgi:hypothetical protein